LLGVGVVIVAVLTRFVFLHGHILRVLVALIFDFLTLILVDAVSG